METVFNVKYSVWHVTQLEHQLHRLIKKTYRTLDVVFLRFISTWFTKTLSQKLKGVTRMLQRERELVQRRMRVTPLWLLLQGYCERKPHMS